MNYYAQRREALKRLIRDQGLDTFLASSAINVTYLSGFSGDSSFLVLTPKTAILVSDDRFAEQIQDECPDIDVHIRPHDKTTYEATVSVLEKGGGKKVGVEANRLTLAEWEMLKSLSRKLTFVPISGLIERLRAIKDPSEVEAIRNSLAVAERAFRMFMAMLRDSDTEKDMVDAMEQYVRRAGGRGTAFPTIAATGERSALPHCPPSLTRRVGEYSKFLIDFGADTGYKSDLTRTILTPFPVSPTRRNRGERTGHNLAQIHNTVLQAQRAAFATIRHGVPARVVDAAARRVIHEAGFGQFFTHGLGHGIGLEIHEAPRVRANSDDILEAGMIITIEPGIYIPGWGGVRVEDDVLVTKDGYSLLSALPHDLSVPL